MLVENKTHYFSEYTRVYNALPDPNSFGVQSSKRMGYFQRLWFEYAYCRKVNGTCLYYTLTYNDKHIPQYRGHNCFSYADIRYITNGALSKWLLRNYGSKLLYFCACESGEGKGIRGKGNNPHYHFIFFIEPADDSRYPYIKVTPQAFKDKIYTLWQGAPSNVFVAWQVAKYGHVQEGLYNGEVMFPDAFKYVGKYVVKDSEQLSYEHQLREELESEIRSFGINMRFMYHYYKYCKLIPCDIRDRNDFLEHYHLRHYWLYRRLTLSKGLVPITYTQFLLHHGLSGIAKVTVLKQWFDNYYLPQYLDEQLSEYRNLWSPKCRMSKQLGIYGLNFIELVDGCPRVVVNTRKGFESQYPCLFYLRKLFYDVKICPYTGNPLYYLNEYGIKLKVNSLPSLVDSLFNKTLENISYKQINNIPVSVHESCTEFEKMPKFVEDLTVFNKLVSSRDYMDIIYRYCVYRLVYQYRSFGHDASYYLTVDCKESDYLLDYSVFLHQNSYYLDYDSGTVFDLYEKNRLYLSFSMHPAFQPYYEYFQYLDKLNDTIDNYISNLKKRDFSDKSAHMKRLNSYRFNCSGDFIPYELNVDSFELPAACETNEYPIYKQLSLCI